MKRFAITLAAFLLVTEICPAQQGSIVIRLVNGRTGKPIRDRQVNIWLGAERMASIDANAHGEIPVDLTATSSHEIRFSPDFRHDCRFDTGFSKGDTLPYSLDEIMTHGIVGANLCGKATSTPTPGVLILFLRPRTMMESWWL